MIDSQKGSVLIIVITGITIITAIGAGLAAMVGSGARTGANHSLSVQARYAAESGFEWAGSELKKSSDWTVLCPNLASHGELPVNIGGQASFTIVQSELYPTSGTPQGCEVTVIGWIGSDEDNPLAKRQLVGKVPIGFIENSGGELDEDWVIYDGGPLPDNLKTGNEVKVYVKEGTDILDDIAIGNKSKVYFSNNVTVGNEGENIDMQPDGYAYFGDGFTMNGNISIKGEACFKNNITINGNLTIDGEAYLGNDITINGNLTINGEACFGNDIKIHIMPDVEDSGKLIVANSGIFCIGEDYSIDCSKINKKNNSVLCSSENDFCGLGLCDDGYNVVCPSKCDAFKNDFCKELGGGVSQNPVDDTGDDGWSEG
jgi:hypothetical protein